MNLVQVLCSLSILLIFSNPITQVDATISIIESGKTFNTKPDRKIGQQLLRGYEYMGRLQYVIDNPTLCPGIYNPNQKFNIVPPNDGLPVALIAQSGGCSIIEKARVASTMINPPNQVQYLIIQDSNKRGRKNQLAGGEDFDDDEEEQEQQNWSFICSTISRYGSFIFSGGDSKIDDDVNDDESYYVSIDSLLVDGDDDEQQRRLLKQFVDFDDSTNNNYGDINLAVLHVSYYAGQTLFNWIVNADPQIHREGGMRVLLNSRESNVSARTVIIWMLVTFTLCACFCCCMLVFVQSSFEEDQQQNAPRRPVRRRLTLEQVRSKFPAFHFNPTEHPQNHSSASSNVNNDGEDNVGNADESQQNRYCQLSDECTICLDEFTPGVRCRQLPCDHVFHSTCIAKWLIERSAVCPLCKLDLYEEEEVVEDEENTNDNSGEESAEPSSPSQSLLSWWSDFFRRRAESSTNNNNEGATRQIEIPSGNQEERTALIAGIDEITTTVETTTSTSWWPFSVQSGVPNSTGEEMHDDDENIQRSSSSSSSAFWGGWTMNLFGRRNRSPTDNDMLTELTEPLVSSSSGEQQRIVTTQEEEVDSSTGGRNETNSPINSNTSAEI